MMYDFMNSYLSFCETLSMDFKNTPDMNLSGVFLLDINRLVHWYNEYQDLTKGICGFSHEMKIAIRLFVYEQK